MSIILPDWNHYDPSIGAFFASGQEALRAVEEMAPQVLALDTETPSVSDPFTIKCVTAAWYRPDGAIQTVILDPLRKPQDRDAVRVIMDKAHQVVLHNSSFDVPGLTANGLMDLDQISKVTDTLIYARMAYPDTLHKKGLGFLAAELLGMAEYSGGMARAFAAAGYKSGAEGFFKMDIDSPIYRKGAMADTVATLLLLRPIKEACWDNLTNHPFESHGAPDPVSLMEREQLVNQIMLRRSARGLAVDIPYLHKYRDQVHGEIMRAEDTLNVANIRPGNGNDLMAVIDEMGDLPSGWPRTPGGKLSSAKGHLEKLDHPLAKAHRVVAGSGKIITYLEQVESRSHTTGRLHPQVNILGASATGRMAYTEPPLQQFAADARPIITDDGQGLTSLDWSQIEPVTMANMAKDLQFLAPFEAGEDLYGPIQLACGLPGDKGRKVAKVVLLATMYGQGITELAKTIKHSQESAQQIKRQMLSAMPLTAQFMGRISAVADAHGKVITVSGRVLSVPSFHGEVAAYKGVNYTCQGSAYDVLAETIVAAEKAGLGKHIQLAMHDELIVDTEAAADIEQIMRKPPEDLVRWSQRVPVLRTDRADMGHAWASV